MPALELKVLVSGQTNPKSIWLLLREGAPLKLGEGKFAKVFLGSIREEQQGNPLGIGDLLAIKFLKRNSSATVTGNSIYRFCKEVDRTAAATSAGLNSLVKFEGYGRVGPLPRLNSRQAELMWEAFEYEVDSPERSHAFFKSRTVEEIDAAFKPNRVSDAIENFDEQFTGDFYCLELCLLSLEELLLTDVNPFSQSSGDALTKCDILDSPVTRNRKADEATLKKLEILLDPQADGFSDLWKIKEWLDSRNDGRPWLGRHFRNLVLFDLSFKCLEAVIQLHEANAARVRPQIGVRGQGVNPGFAHRDIKPANLLVSLRDRNTIVLSDLGFVASVDEIKATNHTILSSIDEGGVLPSGSKGFRAPEQIESGEEFSLSLTRLKTQLKISSYFDTQIEPGDFLKVDSRFADGKSVHRIISHQDDEIEMPSALESDERFQKGRLIKDVSLHSDLFSLGCTAYFFGSEGRNPERFMRQFVDKAAQESLSGSLPGWVLDSPVWLAAVLCQDDTNDVLADVHLALKTSKKPSAPNPAAISDQLQKLEMAFKDDFLSTVGRLFKSHADAKMIAEYRDVLRRGRTHLDLLRGKKNKEPISFPQLYLIFLCCLRGRPGSVVVASSERMDKDGKCLEVYSKDAHTFARNVKDSISGLYEGTSCEGRFGLGDLGFASEILLRARLAKPILDPKKPLEEEKSAEKNQEGHRPGIA